MAPPPGANVEEEPQGSEQDLTNGSALGDENHNPAPKPSINFLNIHLNGGKEDWSSPDRSPTTSRKPYVPPLDLSILHEHGDGSGEYSWFVC